MWVPLQLCQRSHCGRGLRAARARAVTEAATSLRRERTWSDVEYFQSALTRRRMLNILTLWALQNSSVTA